MTICDSVGEFASGEMSKAEAEQFREHLLACPTCPEDLRKTMALIGMLSDLPMTTATVVTLTTFPEFRWRWSWRWFRWEVIDLSTDQYTFRVGSYLYGIEPGMGDPPCAPSS